MPDESGFLKNMTVAAPCFVDWDKMSGDDRIRSCGKCQKHVYNLSAMSQAQAEDLVRKTEGEMCIRLYKRRDGTVIHDNCPVGLRWMRNAVRTAVGIVLAFCFGKAAFDYVGSAMASMVMGLRPMINSGFSTTATAAAAAEAARLAAIAAKEAEKNYQLAIVSSFVFCKLLVPYCSRYSWWDWSWAWLSFGIPFAIGFLLTDRYCMHSHNTFNAPAASIGAGLVFGLPCLIVAAILRNSRVRNLNDRH